MRERIRELCREPKLPTLAAETVGHFSEAGHEDALPTLMEVYLVQETEDRRIRRVDRLRQHLAKLAEGDFVERGVNVLAFDLPSYRISAAQNRQAEDVSHRQ